MHSNFDQINAQVLLNNFRAGNLQALVELRFFVCSKYIKKLHESHPNDEILSDPETRILPADYEDNCISLELLQTDLTEQDLRAIAFLDYQQAKISCLGLTLFSIEGESIRKVGALVLQVLAIRRLGGDVQVSNDNLEETLEKIHAIAIKHQQTIELEVDNYLNLLDNSPPISFEFDNSVALYLLKSYIKQNLETKDYIKNELIRIYHHYEDEIAIEDIEQQAEAFQAIFYWLQQIKQDAEHSDNPQYAELANRVEQRIMDYMLLSCDAKKQAIKQIQQDCCRDIDKTYPLMDRLVDAIYSLVNRVICTLNQKCSTNLQFFKTSYYAHLREDVNYLSEINQIVCQ